MTAVGLRATGRSTTAVLLARSALAVAVIDGLFAIVLYVVVLQRTTVPRLFQGIASTLLGAAAFSGGAATVALGVALHVTVAFTWSVVFLALLRSSTMFRRSLWSRGGALKVAAWFGPLVYVTMTMAVIPLFTHRLPRFDAVWLTVLLGHIPFVALPIASLMRRDAID